MGAELRKLRLRARMSTDAAAKLLEGERTRVSHIEAGRLNVSHNRLYNLLRAFGCSQGPYFDELMSMAQANGKGWWDAFDDTIGPTARNLAELESRSTVLRTHEPLFIPGMLQTEEYARAVLSETEKDAQRADRYVEFRLARQRVLQGDTAVTYRSVIHEAALHTRIGGPQVMRRQLLRLIEVSRMPNVTVQIFPFEGGGYSAYSRTFAMFGGVAPNLDTVYLEHPMHSLFLSGEGQLDEYAKMFQRLSELALAPVDPDSAPEAHQTRDSLSLVQHVMYTL
ncbi:Scr1 family TA system antitoxin-like transcriptional regulator [Streptomyces aurantiacus]|uniref:helix-turn-helix domain-containing protein n=1 Tax=Streptomyces aurantiacus TaxID=47760 RepID=UPI0035E72051